MGFGRSRGGGRGGNQSSAMQMLGRPGGFASQIARPRGPGGGQERPRGSGGPLGGKSGQTRPSGSMNPATNLQQMSQASGRPSLTRPQGGGGKSRGGGRK